MSKRVEVKKGEVWESVLGSRREVLEVTDRGGAIAKESNGNTYYWCPENVNSETFHKLISRSATIHAHMHCGPFGNNPQRYFSFNPTKWKYACSECGELFWTQEPRVGYPVCSDCMCKKAGGGKVDCTFTVSFDPPPEVGEVYYDVVREMSFEIDDKYTRVSSDSEYHIVWSDGLTRWWLAKLIHERGKLLRPVTTNYRCTDVPFTPESDEEDDALQASCYRCGRKYRINLRERASLRKYCPVCGWEMIMGTLPKIGDVHPSHSQFFYAVCQKCGASLGYVPRGYQQLCGDCIKQMLDLFKAKLKPKPSKIDSLKVHQVWESPRDRVRYKIISYAWDGKEVTSVLTETVCSRMRINWPREEAIKHVFGTLIEDASLPEIEPGQKWRHVDKANFVIVGDHPTKKWAVVIDNGFMLTVMARKIIKEECWLISPAKKEG